MEGTLEYSGLSLRENDNGLSLPTRTLECRDSSLDSPRRTRAITLTPARHRSVAAGPRSGARPPCLLHECPHIRPLVPRPKTRRTCSRSSRAPGGTIRRTSRHQQQADEQGRGRRSAASPHSAKGTEQKSKAEPPNMRMWKHRSTHYVLHDQRESKAFKARPRRTRAAASLAIWKRKGLLASSSRHLIEARGINLLLLALLPMPRRLRAQEADQAGRLDRALFSVSPVRLRPPALAGAGFANHTRSC